MEPYQLIGGFDQVVSCFGQWPSFHDGEVLRLVLDRNNRSPAGSYTPTIEVFLRGWVMTTDADRAGFYKIKSDSVVHFLFEDVFDLELEGFNNQNVITSLNLAVIEASDGALNSLHVEFEHCYQFSTEFKARRAKVLTVTPHLET